MDSYAKTFHSDSGNVIDDYLLKSLKQKTRQQVFFERILARLFLKPERIADIACGSGGLSFHLSALYPEALFTLVDLSEQSLVHARKTATLFRAEVLQADAAALPTPSDHFDMVCFWHTLLGVDQPQKVLSELLRICRPGGCVFVSSLFNLHADIDLLIHAIDHTRPSGAEGVRHPYHCYSAYTVNRWIGGATATWHEFELDIDIDKPGRGLGTYTRALADGHRLQISGGMLMNWAILELHKD